MEDSIMDAKPVKTLDQSLEEAEHGPSFKRHRTSNTLSIPSLLVSSHTSTGLRDSNKRFAEDQKSVPVLETREHGQVSHCGLVAAHDGVAVKTEPADRAPSHAEPSHHMQGIATDINASDAAQSSRVHTTFKCAWQVPTSRRSGDYQQAFVRFVARDLTLRLWVLNGCKETGKAASHALAVLVRFNDNTQGPGVEILRSRLKRLGENYLILWNNISPEARCSTTATWKSSHDRGWLKTCELSQREDWVAMWHDWTHSERQSDEHAARSASASQLTLNRVNLTPMAPAVAHSQQSVPTMFSPSTTQPRPPPSPAVSMQSQSSSTSSATNSSPAKSNASSPPASHSTASHFVTQAQYQLQARQIAQLQQHSLQQNHLIREQMNMLSHLGADTRRQAQVLEGIQRELVALRLQRH